MSNRFIDKLHGFVPLSQNDVAVLAAATSHPKNVAARRDLIREGDRPGDSCDLHVGLLAQMDHSIQTVGPALVATIERGEMDAIMDEHPSIAKAMYLAQLIDEGTMRAWITSMGRRTSIERVAHLMCELYLRARNIGLTSERHLTLPLSQILLADSLGMTPVHLNRVLKELRLRGAMLLQRGSLHIADPDKLVEIAGFDENYLHRHLRESIASLQKAGSR